MIKKLEPKHFILIGLFVFCIPIAFYGISLIHTQYEKFLNRPLSYHEVLGGHTIARHIDISDENMIDRFKNEITPKAVSKFYNMKIAEQSIKKVIEDNKEDVGEFLSSHQEYFLLSGIYKQDVGYGTTYKAYLTNTKGFIHTKSLIIVLKRYKGTVFILTAYPEIR